MEWKTFGWILLGIVTFIVIISLFYQRQQVEIKEKTKKTQEMLVSQCKSVHPEDTIFVSVCAVDTTAVATIESLFSQAYCPYRVFVGITNNDILVSMKRNANAKGLLPVQNIEAFLNEHVRVTISQSQATSLHLMRKDIHDYLYHNEKYYLITDSRATFIHNWDQECIQELGPNYSFILTNPLGKNIIQTQTEESARIVPNILTATSSLDRQNEIYFDQMPFKMQPSRLMPQLFWTCAFSFCFSDTIKMVPFDPHMKKLAKHHEELLYSARLWTHGYSFVAPLQSISFCSCKTLNEMTNEMTTQSSSAAAVQRMEVILQIRPTNSVHPKRLLNLNLYGLGIKRKLSDYEAYCHIQLKTNTIGIRATYGCSDRPSHDEMLTKYGATPL